MAGQPSIDIIVNVDTDTLSIMVADHTLAPGTMSNPTSLAEATGVLVTLATQSTLMSNTKPGVVVLPADSGSQLRWTISGFDSNVDYTAYFYAGICVLNPPTFPPIARITYLEIDTIPTTTYLPPGTDPTAAPKKQTKNTQRSSGPTIKAGDELWAILHFSVIDNSNGATIGWFGWTQTFTVESDSAPPADRPRF